MDINELELNRTLDTTTLRKVRGGFGSIGFAGTFSDSGAKGTGTLDSKTKPKKSSTTYMQVELDQVLVSSY